MCAFRLIIIKHIIYSDQITLTVSRDLPMPQENETYSCHFAGVEAPFTVPAVGSGANYMCNITGSIPTQYKGLATGCHSVLLDSHIAQHSLNLSFFFRA